MDRHQQKEKYKAGTSKPSKKRSSQSNRVPSAPTVPHGQAQGFEYWAVTKAGMKWYLKHHDTTYILEVFINRESLYPEYPIMVHQLEQLNMTFVFDQPIECNLLLVPELYAN